MKETKFQAANTNHNDTAQWNGDRARSGKRNKNDMRIPTLVFYSYLARFLTTNLTQYC